MALLYKYIRVKQKDGTFSEVPLIELQLIGKETIIAYGLVDSGSDTLALPKHIADLLGLNLANSEEISEGIGGVVSSAKSVIKIKFGQDEEQYEFAAPCKVILSDQDFPVLLGQRGFFDKFIITFDYLNKEFTLTPQLK